MDDDRVLAALESDPGPFLARWISLMGVAARGHYPHRAVPVEETVARLICINELVVTLSAHLDSLRLEPPYSAVRTVKALNATAVQGGCAGDLEWAAHGALEHLGL